jgi:two-component system OmpR family response regulator
MTRDIAIVEDDPDQCRNYADALSRRGCRVRQAASRAEALAMLEQEMPDLAILDIMLGEELDGGFDLCRALLARNPQLPVIFLTSRSDDIDRISGLRLGAWDYQAKPVSLAYLVERVEAWFRILELRNDGAQASRVRVHGDLELDQDRLQARWRGDLVELTYTELRLLTAIVDHSGERGASYDTLADETRQGVVENNTINTHVRHLRRKLRHLDPEFDCIRNVYGFGYRWGCDP